MRHAVIALREEARRLIEAMVACALDDELSQSERSRLVRQLAEDAEDVRKALLELGGPEALQTVTS